MVKTRQLCLIQIGINFDQFYLILRHQTSIAIVIFAMDIDIMIIIVSMVREVVKKNKKEIRLFYL